MRRALPVAALALAASCGSDIQAREVTDVVTELLYHPELLELSGGSAAVVLHHETDAGSGQAGELPARMRVGHIRPAPAGPGAARSAEAPALLFSPLHAVRFELPPGRTLDAAFGVDARSLGGIPAGASLDLSWSVQEDGRTLQQGGATLTRGGGAPGWSELDLGPAVDRTRLLRLSLETSDREAWAALGEDAPDVGFARMRLLETREVPVLDATPTRPNVVLVVMDTLRGDRTGPGGHDRPTTPHLDALAARGTAYTQALASSSWTWPSTASMLTGWLPEEHGIEAPGASYLLGELDTLAERMRREGAATAAFVGNQLISAPHNFDQGFDRFRSPGRPEFVDAHVLVPEALGWLDEHRAAHDDQRFFLYLHLVDPHRPYQPDPASVAALPADKPADFRHVRPDERFAELWLEANDRADGAPRPLYDELISPAHQAWLDGSYDQVVHTGDLWFGRVLERMTELGIDDETLVVFTSDHGEELFEHGMFDHGQSLYPELVEVPLVVAGPGIPAGREVGEAVANRRVFDLLASAADGALDPSLLERDAGLAFTSTRRGIWNGELARTVHAVRRGRWSLHLAPDSPAWGAPEGAAAPRGGTRRLYDLVADPTEHRDVAADHPAVADELEELLLRRLASSARMRSELGVDGTEGLGGLGAGAATIELLEDIGYL